MEFWFLVIIVVVGAVVIALWGYIIYLFIAAAVYRGALRALKEHNER